MHILLTGAAGPERIDRVYVPQAAMSALAWRPRHGWETVLQQGDDGCPDVLAAPVAAQPPTCA